MLINKTCNNSFDKVINITTGKDLRTPFTIHPAVHRIFIYITTWTRFTDTLYTHTLDFCFILSYIHYCHKNSAT